MQFLITGYDRAKREITGSGELIQFLITGYDRLIWTSPCSLVIFCMKILNGLKAIKEYQVSILIAFIIVSILYGIHMFRYEYVDLSYTVTIHSGDNADRRIQIIRVDRITNDACLYAYGYHYVSVYRGDNSSAENFFRGDTLERCDL